jgi:hypothetical protein
MPVPSDHESEPELEHGENIERKVEQEHDKQLDILLWRSVLIGASVILLFGVWCFLATWQE